MGLNIFGNSGNPVDELRSIFHRAEDPVGEALQWAREVLQQKNIDPPEVSHDCYGRTSKARACA